MSGLRGALPPFRRGALSLFLVTALMTALLGDQDIARALRLHPGALFDDWAVWQPLTANFLFPEGRVGLLLGTLLMQWFIGSPLEGFWGTRKYVVLVLACGTGGYLFYGLLSAWIPGPAQGGSTAMDLAAATAFGVTLGARELQFLGAATIRARTLAIGIVSLTVIAPLLRGEPWPTVIPWLVAIGGALLVTTQPWRPTRDSGKLKRPKSKAKGRANHLRVVRPNKDLMN